MAEPFTGILPKGAAAVDGEMTDVVSNVLLVKAFGGFALERRRFASQVKQEMTARQRSLRYLEKVRLFHAATTALLVSGLLAWAILLWQHGTASTGSVVLVCTLGISVLAATRDLAVALVDITQHMARLAEALSTLLVPNELADHPKAVPLHRAGAGIVFQNISFHYPGRSASDQASQLTHQTRRASWSCRPFRRWKIDSASASATNV